ncbi:DNA-formamidopyrimidine glycosylase [Alkalicoccobacillus murimartini]|uniref:Formamidopyrimidine-DNA glycosylase n=1 Tax=Alkalicoccobacillus murimartini TaxID=171685 RepID=A0ABT9YJQ8_9BACI|nr:DNA-formamidopyrimidine glycosylase [Alkalicoccobacillus murimartini]MDQ0208090.1 formamidopyrimidine-DNA glycosylase [Alkalicoccobacillus murimartini]
MPELPEVETVRRTLEELVIGKTIQTVEVAWPNIIKKPADTVEFADELKGQTIQSMQRRGKFLLFELDHIIMVSHLRMEGRYGVYKKEDEPVPHTHVIFSFTDGMELRYQDVRKFGTMHLFEKGTEEMTLPLSQLGVEPFSNDFTVELLQTAAQKTTRKIKPFLLDQKTVVGLGNIYVDEALFRAGIHPERLAHTLTQHEYSKLHQTIVQTLDEAVKLGGSSIKSYVNGQGEIGMFQQTLEVYGRKNEPCKHCHDTIVRIVVGGRGTHYCPTCQKDR